MHKQCVHHRAHGIVIHHLVVILLPVVLSAIVAQAYTQLHAAALH